MIKSFKILNSQSHAETILNFSDGVNVIVGLSDSGKTAIIRTLRWLVRNRPSGNALRSYWGGETLAQLETEEGIAVRSKDKMDSYQLTLHGDETKTFQAIGTSVPEEISRFLNIDDVNLQSQLDSHFLLSKTPGEVAQHFNKVARLDKIDKGNSNVNSDISELSLTIGKEATKDKPATGLIKQIQDAEKQLKVFDYLDKFEIEVEVLEGMDSKLNRLQKSYDDLILKIDNLREIRESIKQEELILEDEELINTTLENIYRRDAFEENIIDIQGLLSELSTIQSTIRTNKDILEDEELVNNLLNLHDRKEKQETTFYNLSKVLQRLNNIKVLLDKENKNLTVLQVRFKEEFPNICPLCGQEVKIWQ